MQRSLAKIWGFSKTVKVPKCCAEELNPLMPGGNKKVTHT